jgi:hypothetical protein
VYLGWITVATIANIAQTLDSIGFDAFGIEATLVASLVLLVGIVIALTFVWRFSDVAYGAVIVWAYAGIAVKEMATPLVPIVAILGAVIVAVLVVLTAATSRRPAATSMVGVRATEASAAAR